MDEIKIDCSEASVCVHCSSDCFARNFCGTPGEAAKDILSEKHREWFENYLNEARNRGARKVYTWRPPCVLYQLGASPKEALRLMRPDLFEWKSAWMDDLEARLTRIEQKLSAISFTKQRTF